LVITSLFLYGWQASGTIGPQHDNLPQPVSKKSDNIALLLRLFENENTTSGNIARIHYFA
jgi:hypothetical protein